MKKNALRNKGLQPLVLSMLLLFLSVELFAQTVSQYYEKYNLLQAPAAASQDGLLGFANPANLGFLHAPETRFYWTSMGAGALSLNDWALMAAGSNVGFAMQQKQMGGQKMTDYSLAFGAGSDAVSVGFSYDWADGNKTLFGRQRQIKAAAIIRPDKHLSIGFTSFWGLETNDREGVFELGLRPFGTPTLTLFGDVLLNEKYNIGDRWSAGAAWRIWPGIHAVYRQFGGDAFTVGMSLDIGNVSIGSQQHSGRSGGDAFHSYMLRSGGFKNNIFQKMIKKVAWTPFTLKGTVGYQKYVLFDAGTLRLYDLLRDVRAAANDPRLSTLALNLAGLSIRPEHAWELREELLAAREKGKKVIVFFEEVGMTGYYLASAADMVVMDPQGMIMLPGLVMGRTYMKGALEKLGLGFDEWRFFTYKSAYETYSRDGFSDADRQQYNEYIGDWYDMLRQGVCASRQFDADKWDNLINNKALFNGKQALASALVDKLDRWSNINEILKQVAGRTLLKMPRSFLWDNAVLPEQWGERPKVALVYGIGVCDMESGIRARYLQRVFLKLSKEHSVKAVVFRVDSPGGSGMASDVVVEALKKCAEKKPVIVTQGQVAGSGGYWISIYGDKILAGPNTVTGSIGVIGGWVWDKGLSAKLGLTADHVQRGEHADIMSGVTLPLLGLTLPARNLTPEERATVESWIRQHYDAFITKVADGREMTKEAVDKIAQGRFYSGVRGKEIGLVDDIGGLMAALDMAKKDAGMKAGDEFELLQFPQNRGLVDLFSGIPGIHAFDKDPVVRYLKMVGRNPYAPLDMMPPGSYPDIEK